MHVCVATAKCLRSLSFQHGHLLYESTSLLSITTIQPSKKQTEKQGTMMIKTKLPLLFFFLFALLFLSLTPSSLAKYEPTRKDPQTQKEYEKCQRWCEQQETGHTQQCIARCEEQRREQEREDERRRHGGGGGGLLYNADPQKEYEQCQRHCQEHKAGSQQQRQCQQSCVDKRKEQEREEQRGGGGGSDDDFFNTDPQKEYQQCQSRCEHKAPEPRKLQKCQQRCEEKLREQERESEQGGNPRSTTEEEENNPYYYTLKHYNTRVRTSEGNLRFLERFSKRSELLKGIENYRFGILEANPNTFVVPNHIDADLVLYVVKGKGSISLVTHNNRETHNLEQGDVMTVPAGSVVYLINRDNNEKLLIAKLLQSISTPGRVEAFVGTGGEDQESFYSTFSSEILEAAFNTPKGRLQKLLGQQKKGAIIKASREQIKALTPQSRWPFGGGESGGPYNLFHHRPLHSNNFGQLFEVTSKDYKQLRYMDVSVSFANISKGAMGGPFYNTRATKIAVVVEGTGYFEMACPHVASSSGGRHQGGGSLQHHEGSGRYQKISSKMARGDVVVVPAGHPIVTVASQDQNLEVVCFNLNSYGNEMNTLAGRDNVWKQIEKEAKELAFGISARDVDEILNKQEERFFYPGPQQQHEGRAYA